MLGCFFLLPGDGASLFGRGAYKRAHRQRVSTLAVHSRRGEGVLWFVCVGGCGGGGHSNWHGTVKSITYRQVPAPVT